MDNLAPGASLVCYVGHEVLPEACQLLLGAGLTYQWQFVVLHSGSRVRMWKHDVSVGYKPLLWFSRGRYVSGRTTISDVIKSEPGKKEGHLWAQSGVESEYYIKRLSRPGDVVMDPFMGSGVFGASAVMSGRRFVGCETSKRHFAVARMNIGRACGLRGKISDG